MSRATPKIRDFAERLIAFETKGNSSQSKTPAAVLVCEKLRPHLATLMGNAGFRALLSRALSLAHAEFAWLQPVHVKPDGSLEGLDQLAAQVDPDEMDDARIALVAQLLGLLVAFIGENLTVRLVREVWPKLPPIDLNSGTRGKNEETK